MRKQPDRADFECIVSEICNFAMRSDFVRKYAAFSGQNPTQ